jgi:hypothetical protein
MRALDFDLDMLIFDGNIEPFHYLYMICRQAQLQRLNTTFHEGLRSLESAFVQRAVECERQLLQRLDRQQDTLMDACRTIFLSNLDVFPTLCVLEPVAQPVREKLYA